MKYSEINNCLPNTLKIKDARKRIREENQILKTKIVVIDDDPTGCQTVYDIPLLLSWDDYLLKDTIDKEDAFYILTNSRAYSERKAKSLNKEIAQKLSKYIDKGKLRIISRSDSTLRGHFFSEVKTLMDTLGPFDGVIVCPYFKEGKRFTVFDTHYILKNDELIEVNKTEFSLDPVFGYKNSHLPSWIEEKSKGFWKKEDVISISIEYVRLGGPEKIKEILMRAKNGKPIVVNSLCDEDLEVFIIGLIEAEKEGKKFLYRTAASFVKIRLGLEEKDLVIPEERGKGLIIVGSYVELTTRQLMKLLENSSVNKIEVKINEIINNPKFYLKCLTSQIDNFLKKGESIVLYTEREYYSDKKINPLLLGQKISNFLSYLVKNLKEKPEFIIAKGGITSHILAQKGLNVKKAKVLGQISLGIPIWELGEESKYPKLLYIVFPGNVGDENTLLEIYRKLERN